MIGSFIGNSDKNYFGDFIRQEKVIRAAISGCSADEFRNALTDMYNEEMVNGYYFDENIICCNWVVSLILSVTGQQDKLTAFYEAQKKVKIGTDTIPSANYSFFVSLLENDDEFAEYIIRNELESSDFREMWYFVNPLYLLMLTGKYHLLKIALDRCIEVCNKEKCTAETDEPFYGESMSFVVASAAYFGDREFLTLLFDSGYRMDEDIVVQLYSEPDAMEFLIENYRHRTGADKPLSVCGFVRGNYTTQQKLEMGLQILPCYGQEKFERFLEELSPMEKVHILDNNAVMPYITVEWSSADKGKLFLNSLAEKELTVIMHEYDIMDIYDIEKVFSDHSLTYELEYDDDFFEFLSNRALKNILTKNFIFKPSLNGGILQTILSRNNRQLTKVLIKNGMINRDNYEEILDYVISNRYLNALAVLKNSKF